MLGRISLLPRQRAVPLRRVALTRLPIRYYARDGRLKKSEEYKIPENAESPAWQKASRSVPNATPSEPREPLRRVSIPLDEELKSESTQKSTESDRKNGEYAADEVSEADVRGEQEPQQPLPDLTRGIPSTLDAELRHARARAEGARESSTSSLNITEDPAGPVEEQDTGGRGGDGLPRSEYVSSSDRKRETAFRFTYLLLFLGFGGYALYLGRNWDTKEEEEAHAEAPSGWTPSAFYTRIKARLGSTVSYYSDPVTTKLLPDEEKDPNLRFPFVLVISLEDMLVHSEWTRETGWRIAKRPGVDYFLRYLSQYYEIVLFTSQPSAMGDQVLKKLDPFQTIRWPLFREATLYKDGGYIKDLSYLNRDLKKVLIMDTDSHHVKHQPENAIVLPKWKGDPKDQTLVQFIPFLEYLATMGFEDTRPVLKSFDGTYIPSEFARREKLLRDKFIAKEKESRGNKPKKSSGGWGSVFGTKKPQDETADDEGGPKMIWDQIRERGQQQYREFEKKIQEEGPKWLAEREAEEKRLTEEAMKNMTGGMFGWFGSKPSDSGPKS